MGKTRAIDAGMLVLDFVFHCEIALSQMEMNGRDLDLLRV